MLSNRTLERLENWKFRQAKERMEADSSVSNPAPTDEEHNIISTLALLFGDCGWLEGEMGILIAVAVRYLTPPDYRVEPEDG